MTLKALPRVRIVLGACAVLSLLDVGSVSAQRVEIRTYEVDNGYSNLNGFSSKAFDLKTFDTSRAIGTYDDQLIHQSVSPPSDSSVAVRMQDLCAQAAKCNHKSQ